MSNSLLKSLFPKYKALSNSDGKKNDYKKDHNENDNDTVSDSATMGSIKSIEDSCEWFVKQPLLASIFLYI